MGLLRALIILAQVLGLLLVVRVVGRAIARVLQPPSLAGRPASRAVPEGTDLVRDRICNTYVPRDRALTARLDGETRYFCSTTCRDKAVALERAS